MIFQSVIGRFFTFFCLFFLFSLVACSREEEIPDLPATLAVAATPTLQPTPFMPTSVAVTETAVPQAIPPSASFMGVQFAYAATLLNSHTAELLPPIPLSPGPGTGFPERIRFRFGETPHDYIVPRDPQILIYPVVDYEALTEQTAEQMATLRTLLQEQPTTFADPIPLLPMVNATEVFHAQPAYLNFQNGVGVRYLTLYAQSPMPIANDNVFYTFQGLTNDGKYYVVAFFPISSSALPATMSDVDARLLETAESYNTYLSGIVELLNGLASADFSPGLADLDYIVQSLLVTPDAGFPSPTKPVGVVYEGIYFTFDNTLASDVTAETIPTQLTNPDGTTTSLEGIPDSQRFIFTLDRTTERPSTLLVQPIRDNNGEYYPALPATQRQYYDALNEQLAAQADPGSGQAKMGYIDFANGTGVHYVTHLANSQQPVTNQSLFYVFEGFTGDRTYYVRLEFAVSTGALAESGELSQEDVNNYAAYVERVIRPFDDLQTADFTPDLVTLDQLIKTLFVDSAALSAPPVVVNPTDCTDDLAYVDDITIPDNTRLTAGQTFTKIWRVRNTGTCTWDGRYQWVFVNGEQFQGVEAIPFPAIVAPGEEFDIGIDLIAPTIPGTYQGWWQLQDPTGNLVGTDVYLLVEVP